MADLIAAGFTGASIAMFMEYLMELKSSLP